MKKRILPLILLVWAFCGNATAQNPIVDSMYCKIREVLSAIADTYVDTVNQEKLVNSAIKIAMERLDPHSTYRTAKEVMEENRKLNPQVKTLGMDFRLFDDTLTVVRVNPESHAFRVGFRPGAQIQSINGQLVSERLLKISKINQIINDCTDDSISIKCYRNKSSKSSVLPVYVEKNSSIESHYAPNDTSIYVKVSMFTKQTAHEFHRIIESYSKKKRRNIILDLRDNQGGVLQSSVDICEEFLTENMLMLSSRGVNQKDTNYFATDKGLLTKSRICVLMNENSASASEVIAGCLQDWDRGVVIGRRSYGKGVTQQIIPLSDGSQLRITNSRLYTPSGRCVQKNFMRGKGDAYFNEIAERKNTGENTDRSKINTRYAPKYQTILKLRTVYGNMGVIPDVFVPEDTTLLPEYWKSWISAGTIDNFVYDQINSYRQRISSLYSSYKIFMDTFIVSDQMMSDLHAYSAGDTSKNMKVSRDVFLKGYQGNAAKKMRNYMKSRYAYALFSVNESRQVINSQDSDYLTALRLINNPDDYYEALSGKNM